MDHCRRRRSTLPLHRGHHSRRTWSAARQGGFEDHVHLYVRWRPDGSLSDLMRTVKSRSSKWIHETLAELAAFAWQEGYAVFTVSKSQEESVKAYIASQRDHHRQHDFKIELLRLLRAHEVEFEERYVFD